MYQSPLDTTNLNLRSSKWWPPDLPLYLPPPIHYSNIAPEVKQLRITITILQHNVQRDFIFLKKDFGLRGWEEYEKVASILPTLEDKVLTLIQHHSEKPTTVRSIEEPAVSYAISREHQAHLGFLRWEMGEH